MPIVCLEESNVLVDNRIRELEIQIRFAARLLNRDRRFRSVDEGRNRVCALRDVGLHVREEQVQVLLGVVVAFLEDPQRVVGMRLRRRRDLVHSLDALRRDELVAVRQPGR